MVQIEIRGVIVPDDDLWIYEWFDMTATAPQMVRKALKEAAGDEVVVIINSGGGDVQAGQEMYTALRDYAGKVTIRVYSLAASAASVVAMAGDSEISPVAQLMIHNVSCRASGDHRDMEHAATVLVNANEALAAAYVAKTGKSKEDILALMAEETWFTAEQAVQEGFIDRIMFAGAAGGQTSSQPLQLAAAYGADLLPQNVIEYAKKHFNNHQATAKAAAQYQYLILEGKYMTKEQYMTQRAQLLAQAKQFLDAGNIDSFNQTKQEIEKLDSDYEAHAQAQANLATLEGSAVVPAAVQSLGTSGAPAAPTAEQDPYATPEYVNAFKNFVCSRTPIPEKFRNAAESTTSEDAGAAIPTTMMQEIIRGLEERGLIFQSLRHLNVAGGVEIPVSDLKPVATWVGDDASEDQKLSANESISFKYYGLECKISQSILTSIVTVAAFQKLFVELAVEAVFAAVEIGVFNGTGNKQMLGIFKDPRVKTVVTLKPNEFTSFAAWKKKVFAKIKKRYSRGKFYMAEGTFQGYIDGMVDEMGQPVGRTNYGIDADPSYGFGGKRVETVEDDVIAPYDTAADGDYVAAYVNLKDFVFNSNMQMTVVHWTDHDNNKKKTKVMLICDGKIADPNGVILVKKGAAA